MKTTIIFTFLFFCTTLFTNAQPKKGSFEIGGSGYRTKIYNNNELNNKITEINTEVSYFILKHLSLGARLTYQRNKDFEKADDPVYQNFYFAPTLDAYILNRNKIGVTVKGAVNFAIKNDIFPDGNKVSSYMIGPKIAWNISQNLSTFLWIAYRKLESYDNTTGFQYTIPSDNFDIRWGFSYYLHRKTKIIE